MTAALASKAKPSNEQKTAKPKDKPESRSMGFPAHMGGAAMGSAPAFLQRQPMDIVQDEEEIADGAVQRLPQDPFPDSADEDNDDLTLQPKLQINTPGDKFEREADQVAAAVTHAAAPAAPSLSPTSPAIQRKCAACGGEAESSDCPKCRAQRKELSAKTPKSGTSAAKAIQQPGAGKPISERTRAPIEAHLGADLSHVRVHADSHAQEAAGSINAKAFTHGHHIWLGRGQSADDLGLMAHEATHTVQQNSGGATGPNLVQRKPSDHQHPEDGAAPQARITGELDKEKEEQGEPDPDEQPPKIDPAEKQAKAGPLKSKAKPDADRPAQEGPKVAQASNVVQQEAEKPGEKIVEGQAKEPDATAAQDTPEQDATPIAHVQAAMAAVASLPEPQAPPPIEAPPIARPINGDGQPVPSEAQGEAQVISVAAQLQVMREGAFALRRKAKQQKANALVMRGNVEMAEAHILEAETGLSTAHGHMEVRREVISEAHNAHATSEQKAQTVSQEAPPILAEAEEAQDESGPMASEASDTAAQNDANKPDDPDAAAENAESGAQMNSVAGDSASMDQASTATAQRATQLQEDAARSKERNAEALGMIEASTASADQTDTKLVEMDGQAATARAELDGQRAKPDAAEGEAARLDAEAAAIDESVAAKSLILHQVQRDFLSDMAQVPGSETLAKNNPQSPAPSAAQPPAEDGWFTSGKVEAGKTDESGFAPRGYEGRAKVSLPMFNMGTPLTEEQRAQQAEAAAKAEEKRRSRIQGLQDGVHGDFSKMDALDKAGVALDFMMEDAFGSMSKIKWPDFSAASVGKALLNIIDPRGPINGILGGLSTVASGALNLFDMDQWARDPLGNLLKSAADIATGITVILGSIVALLGVVTAISAAAIVLSWFTLAPVLTPVITWCTSAGITVGGWTISVGMLALYFQSLLIIKNIVDVMTAETAEELVQNTEQLQGDFAQMGEIGMQMGTAYLGAKGGPGMLDDIAEQGIRTVAKNEVIEGLRGAAEEVVLGEDIAGFVGNVKMARGVHGHMRGGGGGSAPKSDSGDVAPKADADTAPQSQNAASPKPDTPPPNPVDAPTPTPRLDTPDGGPQPRVVDGPDPQPSRPMDSAPPETAAPKPPTDGEAGATGSKDQQADAKAPTTDASGGTPKIDGGGEVQRPDFASDVPKTKPLDEDGNGGSHPKDSGDGGGPQNRRPDAEPSRSGRQKIDPSEASSLRKGAQTKTLDQMSPREKQAEFDAFAAAPKRPAPEGPLKDVGITKVAETPEGRRYGTHEEANATCRLGNCGCSKNTPEGEPCPNCGASPITPSVMAADQNGLRNGTGDQAGATPTGANAADSVSVLSGDGVDQVNGQKQNTSVAGADGPNTVAGAEGANTVNGADGANRVSTAEGSDAVPVNGANTMAGADGANTVTGADGANTVTGASGANTIAGGDGTILRTESGVKYADLDDAGRATEARKLVSEAGVQIDAQLIKQLKELGYSPTPKDATNPRAFAKASGNSIALPKLKVEGNTVKIDTGKSETVDQRRTRRRDAVDLDPEAKRRREELESGLEQKIKDGEVKIAYNDGVAPTDVSWSQVLKNPKVQEKFIADVEARLKKDNPNITQEALDNKKDQAKKLIEALAEDDTKIVVVIGTSGHRDAFGYTGTKHGADLGNAKSGKPDSGMERHHVHPLYAGGGHTRKLLADLDSDIHLAVHKATNKITFPESANLIAPDGTKVSLENQTFEPTSLQNKADPVKRSGVTVVHTSGDKKGEIEIHDVSTDAGVLNTQQATNDQSTDTSSG